MVGSVGMSGLWALLAQNGGPTQSAFSQIDSNGDGLISFNEFAAIGQNLPAPASSTGNTPASNLLSQIDTNGDGKISQDEASAFQRKVSAEIQALILQIQEQNGSTTASAANPPSASDIFNKMDTNGDGSVSQDELTAALKDRFPGMSDARAAQIFARIDTNGDGSISPAENQAFADKMQARHHHHHHMWLSRLASQTYADASTTSTTSDGSTTGTDTTSTTSQTA